MPGFRKLFSSAKDVRDAAQERNRLQRRSRSRSGGCAAERRRTKEAAGPDQLAGTWKNISGFTRKAGPGWRLRKGKGRSSRKTSRGIERERPAQRGDGFDRQARPGN